MMHATPFCRSPRLLVLAAAACLSAFVFFPARAADDASVAPFSTAPLGEPPPVWKFLTLPNKVPTKYSIVELNGAHVLKVQADESYGNLVFALKVPVTDKSTVSWRWRVDKLVEDADLKTRAGEDAPAKVCVSFGFDSGKLPLSERTKLAIARTTTGQDVPSETLCYVYDNKLPPETGVVSPFTRRIRSIVLDSGSAQLTQWISQKRNVVADYQRMFGDESEGKTPDVTGVSVSADADNTHGHGLSYFGDVTLTP